MPKERRLPEVLNNDEIEALLALFNRRYPTSWRNQLMIKTALKTGMRISELINLKFEDLTPKGGMISAHLKKTKGSRHRVIWIQSEIYEDMLNLAEKMKRESKGSIFTTIKGDPVKDAYLRKMIAVKGLKATGRRIHFHLLRHTALTRLYSNTKDILTVQRVAGHADPKTSAIYAHVSGEDIRDAMAHL
jgi:integrase